MQRHLVGRRFGEEEPGVEALGGKGGRDPVGVRRHQVDGEFEILGLDQIDDAGLVLGEPVAPAPFDRLEFDRADQRALTPLASEQNAALLERLSHAGDAERQLLIGDAFRGARPGAKSRIAIGGLELAAGKDQRARKESI